MSCQCYTADGSVLVTLQGSTYTRVLFWTFFQSRSQGFNLFAYRLRRGILYSRSAVGTFKAPLIPELFASGTLPRMFQCRHSTFDSLCDFDAIQFVVEKTRQNCSADLMVMHITGRSNIDCYVTHTAALHFLLRLVSLWNSWMMMMMMMMISLMGLHSSVFLHFAHLYTVFIQLDFLLCIFCFVFFWNCSAN